ncbi:MAG: aspartate kinase [Deferribacterota bacterium]|nr:aspartate kinase [Deferribacterota bacterium]
MKIVVMKFGGTSVGSVEKIRNVANIIENKRKEYDAVVVTVSAMAGETDRLIGLLKSVDTNYDPRLYDVIVSTGEQVSIALLSQALLSKGIKAKSYTGWQAGFITDDSYSKSRIIKIDTTRMKNDLANGYVCVVAGFQGITESREDITTLGRGGSDTTAVALACALDADFCEIYTDVDGVYTGDPRKIKGAKKLDKVSYREMLELSAVGAKVLHSRSVEIAMKYNIPVKVLSSLEKKEGTIITSADLTATDGVAGVAISEETKYEVLDNLYDKNLIERFSKSAIDYDMLNIEDRYFSLYVKDSESDRAYYLLLDLYSKDKIKINKDRVKISVVGNKLKNNMALFNKLRESIKNKCNCYDYYVSYIRYSFVVDKIYASEIANLVHNETINIQ